MPHKGYPQNFILSASQCPESTISCTVSVQGLPACAERARARHVWGQGSPPPGRRLGGERAPRSAHRVRGTPLRAELPWQIPRQHGLASWGQAPAPAQRRFDKCHPAPSKVIFATVCMTAVDCPCRHTGLFKGLPATSAPNSLDEDRRCF